MKTLYIAEKAAAGKALAAYLSKTSGIPARAFKTHVIVGDDTVGWLQGHVLEQVEPEVYDPAFEDRGNFALLPIIPQQFKLKVVKSASHLVAAVRDLLKETERVIHFCDPDREGQLIGDELLGFLGNRKPVLRLWTSALDDASLSKALLAMRDNATYRGYSEAALARSHADWLYGINMSRAVTIAARHKGARAYFTVGRVQTPTLALVVHREAEINAFVPVKHHKPWLDLATQPGFRARWTPPAEDGRLDGAGLLTSWAVADGIVAAAGTVALVTGAATVPGSLNPPLPFSLSALQALCADLFGFSPVKTLHVAESLYLKKITSYPRASSDHLPESQHAEAPSVLTSLAKSPLPTSFGTALRGAKVSLKSKAWDDVELKKHGHHAIVPVHLDNPGVLAELSDDENRLYGEIVKRYVLQFWPAAQFLTSTVDLEAGAERYQASGRQYTDEGWRKAFAQAKPPADAPEDTDSDSAGTLLPALTVGQSVPIGKAGMDSLETKPPKRFTEGTLLTAMKSVHQFVRDASIKARLKENAGIGTEATRAETIKGLFDKSLVELDGRYVVPTANGAKLIGVLPVAMTSPDMTALWEGFLDALLSGKATYSAFMEKQALWLRDMVQASPRFFDNVEFPPEPGGGSGLEVQETAHLCNACNSPLRRIKGKNGWFFGCSSMACKKTFRDKDGLPVEREPVTDSGILCPECKKHHLARRERTKKDGFFWSCTGWKPEKKGCNASFNDKDGVPDLVRTASTAPAARTRSATDIACPGCKTGVLLRRTRKNPADGHFWSCTGWKEGCKCAYNDRDGKPVFEKSAGSGRAGNGAGAPSTATVPAAAASTGNRFLDGLSGRGLFGGGKSKK